MTIFLFHLGREPELSAAEIEAVFLAGGKKYIERKPVTDKLIIETEQPLDISTLMRRLGGTIKISERLLFSDNCPPPSRGREEGVIPLPSNPSHPSPIRGWIVDQVISHLLTAQPAGKIDFAVPDRTLALKIKKELKAQGRGARFIAIKNTATILFNQLVEKQSDLTVLNDQVFVTRAIQPIAELNERDYGRPGNDAKGGMLPPKLAKIMINLAQVPLDAVILDPFCGSGTILMEAAVIGYKNLIGSDTSAKAIANTKKNVEWAVKKFQVSSFKFQVFQSDSRLIHQILKPNSVDAIITEPYLGKPLTGRETRSFLECQARELAALYTAALASFQKILKPRGVVVFITPAFKYKNKWITPLDLSKSMPKISGPLRYHRPGQHLARDIWRFIISPSYEDK